MKNKQIRKWIIPITLIISLACYDFTAAQVIEDKRGNDKSKYGEYLKYWNSEVQEKINRDIEKYRKSDTILLLKDIQVGSKVSIEQISHQFLFGGNIFLFGEFKDSIKNSKYESVFGNLFNAATVPFYWKTLEPIEEYPRYTAESAYEYRRPPTDPVVEFCRSKDINMNGHALIYGMRKWGQPSWMPENRKIMEKYFEKHIREIATRYGNQIQRWDVVNEPTDQANRGLMPDDYTYKSFKWASKYFPESVLLNINDADLHWDMNLFHRYLEIVRNLLDRGINIGTVGIQMHIFNPDESKRIINGENRLTPEKIYERLDLMAGAERPLHISEVTISAPDDTKEGSLIQAQIARNLYRLWFSYPSVMGITWWNVVDGGAAAGEPSFSGILDKELKPKPVYKVLENLINKEWITKKTTIATPDGLIAFRGFKGKYKISWVDKSNIQHIEYFVLR